MYSGIADIILTFLIGIMVILIGNGRIINYKTEEAKQAFKKKHGSLMIVLGGLILLTTIVSFILWYTRK